MACGSCAAKREAKDLTYTWTKDGKTIVYPTLMAAKSKVLRAGGSYKPTPKPQE